MEEDKKCSGLRAVPLSPLHVNSNSGRNKKIGVAPDVFKNKVWMALEVGVAVCEKDVSGMTEEQAVCLNKPCQCNPGLSSSKRSNPHAIHACS